MRTILNIWNDLLEERKGGLGIAELPRAHVWLEIRNLKRRYFKNLTAVKLKRKLGVFGSFESNLVTSKVSSKYVLLWNI